MMLADMGADVIKIESRKGDLYRAYQKGLCRRTSRYNCKKRGHELRPQAAADREIFDQLVAGRTSTSRTSGPARRTGSAPGWSACTPSTRSSSYCSISGFGSDGPYSERPSYDSVAQALSGFLSVVVDPERPRFLGPALADAITGIYAAQGILGALLERTRTGQGRLVEVSMFEAMAHFAVEPFAAYFALGAVPTSSDRPRLAQAYILRTGDGRLLAIHLSSLEKFWQGLLAALDAAELNRDARFNARLARIDHYEALGEELDRRFRQRPLAEWAARLSANDVPFAPINGIDAVVEDPQARHLGLIVPVEDAREGGRQAVRPAFQFDGRAASSVSAAPLLNQHGDEIRAALARERAWPARTAEAPARRAAG